MAPPRPIQFSLRTLLLMVTLAATMLWAVSWLGGASALAICFIVLIASAVAAGKGCWLYLENDAVHFGIIGAVVGFLSSFLGAVYYLSVPGGIVLGAVVGDVLSDLRREPLFAGRCRRRRSWQLIARGDRVPLARLALAVACLAALSPLAGFWIANAISPSGIELNTLAADFWEYGVREWESRQSLLDGGYWRQHMVIAFVANWHVLGMFVLCLAICFRLRRRKAEPPVVDVYLAHVSTAFALAMLLFSLQLSQGFYYALTYGSYHIHSKQSFFELCFWYGLDSAPVIVTAPLVFLALGPYRGRFLRRHVWLPALAVIGLLNIVLLLGLIGWPALALAR